jgi:polyphosphate kinase
MAKLNALNDEQMIEHLYRASKVGVKIRLSVRGACCLKPGVPGMSENITVSSVIDRFLEHSRILYFGHDGDPRVYISSADWMSRNLDRRVELLVPIEDHDLRDRLVQYLRIHLSDNMKARRLTTSGAYKPVTAGRKTGPIRSQQELYRLFCESDEAARNMRPTMLEPHIPPEADDE